MFTRSKHGENRLWHQKTLSLILAIIMIAGTLVLPISSAELGETQGDSLEPEIPFEFPCCPEISLPRKPKMPCSI